MARSMTTSCARHRIIDFYMALITLLDAQLAFGHVALLDHADFSQKLNQRIGLIGRNGTANSLLKILAGLKT
jgi:ATP-binding cassette subfamily F protein uup